MMPERPQGQKRPADMIGNSARVMRISMGEEGEKMPHAHMVALYTYWYDFARIQKTLRCTLAMAACVTDRLWSIKDVVTLLDAREAAPANRSRYKPCQAKAA